MAFTYEGVLLFGVVFFFGYAFSALTRHQNQSEVLRWAFQAWIFLVLGVYFVWSWSAGRRTLPMKTVGLRVLGPQAEALSPGRALARYVCAWATLVLPLWAAAQVSAWLAVLLGATSMVCVVVDRRHRAPWDFAAGTLLAYDPSTEPGKAVPGKAVPGKALPGDAVPGHSERAHAEPIHAEQGTAQPSPPNQAH